MAEHAEAEIHTWVPLSSATSRSVATSCVMWMATFGLASWRLEIDWLRLDLNPRLRLLELVSGEKGLAERELRDVMSVLEYTKRR